ncbi:MAG TPA: DUF1697 domain-containing protein [Sandaracinaceae bacterium LLY-WYZ-13_1]|nr:DUF1697 domain-containing protein [Sandaracinaceae bacterium LLY-WYZ-13_1]
MARWVAFLRAVNVGGRTAKMDRVRALFEELRLGDAETFLASGNVLFDSRAKRLDRLETRIEARLADALGFEVATFVRSPDQLAHVATHTPFDDAQLEGGKLQVAILREAPTREAFERVRARCGAIDDVALDGRELYWVRRGGVRESALSNAILERELGMPSTVRNVSTIRRILTKLG